MKNDVFVIDLMNDLMFSSSSRCADFLYSILQDLTIIKALNSSLIFLLLKPKLTNASVLALSRNFK
jgi:hypothetical protein